MYSSIKRDTSHHLETQNRGFCPPFYPAGPTLALELCTAEAFWRSAFQGCGWSSWATASQGLLCAPGSALMHVCESQGNLSTSQSDAAESFAEPRRWDYQASAANANGIIKIRLVTPHQLDLRIKWRFYFYLSLRTQGWKYQTCERLSLSRVQNPSLHLNLLISSLWSWSASAGITWTPANPR